MRFRFLTGLARVNHDQIVALTHVARFAEAKGVRVLEAIESRENHAATVGAREHRKLPTLQGGRQRLGWPTGRLSL